MTSSDKARGFEVILTEEEEKALQSTLSSRFEEIMAVLSSIDAQKAQATHEADKEMIMGKIRERTGGLQDFNTAIIGALRTWLLQTAKALLQTEGNERDTRLLNGVGRLQQDLGFFSEAMTCYMECLRITEAESGPDHPDVATTQVLRI